MFSFACSHAEDAVKGRDGYVFDNNPIRVELSRGGMGGRRCVRSSSLIHFNLQGVVVVRLPVERYGVLNARV